LPCLMPLSKIASLLPAAGGLVIFFLPASFLQLSPQIGDRAQF
jgi:hypothetical protein